MQKLDNFTAMKKSKESRFSALKGSKVIEWIGGFVMFFVQSAQNELGCFIIFETMQWILMRFGEFIFKVHIG